MQALKGVRVCDLTRVLAGPTCTQILGDLGADVIKVEQPGVGDITRTWGPPFEKDEEGHDTTESAYYLSCNRNKRSIELDYTTAEGLEILIKLIKTSDIFVENFKTGTLDRYGLSYEDVKAINPRIIYCSITGFGHTGPWADQPGYDFQVQGLSGMMSLNGHPEDIPVRVGISLADISTGVYSALAIMTALYHRERTGEGQRIDMALFDTQMAMLSFAAQSYLLDGKQPQRTGNAHPNIVPYGVFPTSDGHVILGLTTNAQFQKFCECIRRPDIPQDPRFSSNDKRVENRETLFEVLYALTKEHSTAQWIESMEKLNIPSGPVNTFQEAFEHPQAQARGFQTSRDGLAMVASPLRLGTTPPVLNRRAPHLGEHTDEILKELNNKELNN